MPSLLLICSFFTMTSLNKKSQIRSNAFNIIFRYLSNLLMIFNIYFAQMFHRICPDELQLDKAIILITKHKFWTSVYRLIMEYGPLPSVNKMLVTLISIEIPPFALHLAMKQVEVANIP